MQEGQPLSRLAFVFDRADGSGHLPRRGQQPVVVVLTTPVVPL